MINNFKAFEPLLDFQSEDDFYFVQIIQREKDNPGLERNMNVIDEFFIYNLNDYWNKSNRIIDVCKKYNARAYIRVNKRSLEKVGMQTMKKVVDLLLNGEYKAIRSAYSSACGNSPVKEGRKWIVDVDSKLLSELSMVEASIENMYADKQPDGKIVAVLPTVNGYHIICTPFNVLKFNAFLVETQQEPMDIHKDNMTILYFP